MRAVRRGAMPLRGVATPCSLVADEPLDRQGVDEVVVGSAAGRGGEADMSREARQRGDRLVDVGDVVDRHGNSPLHIAAQNGKSKTTKLLLSYGFNINAQNNKGQTPLHYAKTYKYTKVVELLIAMGAKSCILNSFGFSSDQGISPYK